MSHQSTALEVLLNDTRRIVKHQDELKILRGESFNIFSILKMESRENETHSAFIAELLKPNGSHHKGSKFLELFLKTINCESINENGAEVILEHHIGFKDNSNLTGGRIDIFIKDNQGNSLSFENKIYADDQPNQLERYYNYNRPNNKVYYLNLFGDLPSNSGKGNLTEEEFTVLSYKDHILVWLSDCLKESVDAPILRESIKQYMILIRKLTNTMDNENQKELTELILNHFEEANYIISNFANSVNQLKEKVRQLIFTKLKLKLEHDFVITEGSPAWKTNSQIWIQPKAFLDSKVHFGLESFSGQTHYNGFLFVGVFNGTGKSIAYPGQNSISNWWPSTQKMETFNTYNIDLSDKKTLIELLKNDQFMNDFTEHVALKTEEFVKKELPTLISYIANVSQSSKTVTL